MLYFKINVVRVHHTHDRYRIGTSYLEPFPGIRESMKRFHDQKMFSSSQVHFEIVLPRSRTQVSRL